MVAAVAEKRRARGPGTGRPLEELLRKAAPFLARRGYRRVSVDDIAAELGLSKGGFYWHFKSKEDFYRRICRMSCDGHLALCRRLLQAETLDRADILEGAKEVLRSTIGNPLQVRLLFEFQAELQGVPEIREEMERLHAEWEELLRRLVRRCMADGILPAYVDADAAARDIQVMFDGLLFDFNIRRNTEAVLATWERFLKGFIARRSG
ncbi:MAG: TetR/AcrR family transcriptional regulator [Planctomycetota bacterium]